MSGRASLSTGETTSILQALPPSAKLVAKRLEYEGELTRSQLADSTPLPARTVRNALTRLEEKHPVTSRISLMDARQRIYSLDVQNRRG